MRGHGIPTGVLSQGTVAEVGPSSEWQSAGLFHTETDLLIPMQNVQIQGLASEHGT